MVTSVMRSKTDKKNQNSLSSLYFWDEINNCDYHLNTRIDNIHGERICGIINFKRRKENSEGFFMFIFRIGLIKFQRSSPHLALTKRLRFGGKPGKKKLTPSWKTGGLIIRKMKIP